MVGNEDSFRSRTSGERTRVVGETTGSDHGNAQDKAWARARMRAVKQCKTSIYLVAAAVPGFLLGGGVGLILCGAVAAAFAARGLLALRALGPGPPNAEEMPGVVRVAATMGRSAPSRGTTGLVLGLLLIGAGLAFLAYGAMAQKRRDAELERWTAETKEEIANLERSFVDNDPLWSKEAEITQLLFLDAEAAQPRRLPQVELARRVRRALRKLRNSMAANAVLEGRTVPVASLESRLAVEPWATAREVHASFAEVPADTLERDAIDALDAMVQAADATSRPALLEALDVLASTCAHANVDRVQAMRAALEEAPR